MIIEAVPAIEAKGVIEMTPKPLSGLAPCSTLSSEPGERSLIRRQSAPCPTPIRLFQEGMHSRETKKGLTGQITG